VSAGAWLMVGAAWACAVCGGQDDADTKQAFIDTTIFLSLLPLGLMGGGAWWIYQRSQALEPPPPVHEV
jgi:hypothetical protein